MKLFALISVCVVCAAMPPVFADTVTLKSGEVVEGEIVADTNDVVQISVPNAKRTIFSIRSVKRGDIQDIQRASAEQTAYQELQLRQLGRASFTVAYYDQTISDVFQKFLADYPQSAHAPTVTQWVTQWTAERDRVAAGAVKWANRWYEGAAVKLVTAQIKAAQLVDDGDRLLGYARYEAAIAKYREALANQPFPASLVEQAGAKVTGALQRWKTALATDNSANIAKLDQQNQTLQSQREQHQQAIDRATEYQQVVASAQFVYVKSNLKRWVASQTTARFPANTSYSPPPNYDGGSRRGHDLGQVLPDARGFAAEIQRHKGAIKTIDDNIAANNASKASQQTSQANAGAELQKIAGLTQEFGAELTQFRAAARQWEADAAGRQADEAARLAASVSTPEPNQTAVPVPSEEVPSVPSTSVAAPEAPAAALPKSWWAVARENWIYGAVLGVVVLYIGVRQWEKRG